MRFSTRFMRHCPTCGRNLDIGVEQIGRMVMCSHCHAEFQATLVASLGDNDIEQSLDQRIERLIHVDEADAQVRRLGGIDDGSRIEP